MSYEHCDKHDCEATNGCDACIDEEKARIVEAQNNAERMRVEKAVRAHLQTLSRAEGLPRLVQVFQLENGFNAKTFAIDEKGRIWELTIHAPGSEGGPAWVLREWPFLMPNGTQFKGD